MTHWMKTCGGYICTWKQTPNPNFFNESKTFLQIFCYKRNVNHLVYCEQKVDNASKHVDVTHGHVGMLKEKPDQRMGATSSWPDVTFEWTVAFNRASGNSSDSTSNELFCLMDY